MHLGCDVLYLKEPPPYIRCNPYSYEARLVLQCQIQLPAMIAARASIQWIFQDSQGKNHPITKSQFAPLFDTQHQRMVVDHELLLQQTSITLDGTSLTSLDHQGLYFCQMLLNESNITSFATSGALEIEDEDHGPSHYLNFHPCAGIPEFINTKRCAGNISKMEQDITPPNQPITGKTPRITLEPMDSKTELMTRDLSQNKDGGHIIYYMLVIIVMPLALSGIAIVIAILLLIHRIKRAKAINSIECKF